MAATITGIRAQHPGKCPLPMGCGQPWEVGDLIERWPGEDNKRGHADCVAQYIAVHGRSGNGNGVRSNVTPLHQRENGNGAPTSAAPVADAKFLFTFGVGVQEIAQGLTRVGVALVALARRTDPTVDDRTQ